MKGVAAGIIEKLEKIASEECECTPMGDGNMGKGKKEGYSYSRPATFDSRLDSSALLQDF